MLSPDGYTILPIRPVTTTRTVAIFMVLQLDRNLHIVNAPPFSEARSSVGYWSAGRTSQSWVERFESASTAEQREPAVSVGSRPSAIRSMSVKLCAEAQTGATLALPIQELTNELRLTGRSKWKT